jgi:lysophospholipase L1-like esterase
MLEMIKPPKIFLYYLTLGLVFVAFDILIPEKGFEIGNGNYTIRWISAERIITNFFLQETGSDSIDIDSSSFRYAESTEGLSRKDSISVYSQGKDSITVKNHEDTYGLQYPESFRPMLYSFYKKISSAVDSSKVIRILHMGDSQIEGDRITRFLRESFQCDFKGCGPGLIPVYDPQKHFPSVWISNKGKWREHAVYKYPRLIKNNQYGILGKVAKIDSLGFSSITISASHMAQPKASVFYKSSLFMKSIADPILIKAHWEGQLVSSDLLPAEEDITEINWTFEQAPKRFTIDLKVKTSPVFLGLSLDSIAGVSVDNIAMRGQLTPRLEKTDTLLYRSMGSYMNIGMIVLQYGTNIVPTITDNYSFYSYAIYKQLKIFKKILPNVPVVVIGVGDVATKMQGKAESYKHVYKIKEAQKKAAFRAGFAFFDLYEAMGGEGSMINWVNEEPALAMSDYTHFNKRGGEKVADWIYNAIMKEYKDWKKMSNFSHN